MHFLLAREKVVFECYLHALFLDKEHNISDSNHSSQNGLTRNTVTPHCFVRYGAARVRPLGFSEVNSWQPVACRKVAVLFFFRSKPTLLSHTTYTPPPWSSNSTRSPMQSIPGTLENRETSRRPLAARPPYDIIQMK